MKTSKGATGRDNDNGELHKAKRLEPLRRSGKERHTLYNNFQEEDDDEAVTYTRRGESAYDYFDDGEE